MAFSCTEWSHATIVPYASLGRIPNKLFILIEGWRKYKPLSIGRAYEKLLYQDGAFILSWASKLVCEYTACTVTCVHRTSICKSSSGLRAGRHRKIVRAFNKVAGVGITHLRLLEFIGTYPFWHSIYLIFKGLRKMTIPLRCCTFKRSDIHKVLTAVLFERLKHRSASQHNFSNLFGQTKLVPSSNQIV